MPTTESTTEPKRLLCRHIFPEGRRCGSPSLRGEPFCYFHHTSRKPVAQLSRRRARQGAFTLPMPEDRAAIQLSIGEILARIVQNQLDPRRARRHSGAAGIPVLALLQSLQKDQDPPLTPIPARFCTQKYRVARVRRITPPKTQTPSPRATSNKRLASLNSALIRRCATQSPANTICAFSSETPFTGGLLDLCIGPPMWGRLDPFGPNPHELESQNRGRHLCL